MIELAEIALWARVASWLVLWCAASILFVLVWILLVKRPWERINWRNLFTLKLW